MTEFDENDLRRFGVAQGKLWSGYDLALSEIRSGRKVSHWIWYIFPQLRGLGHSRRSFFYGLAGRKEAEAYLQDATLGPRLREISRALLSHAGKKTAEEIRGYIDAIKVRSCMTLFDCISPGDVFAEVLEAFYGRKRDRISYERLEGDFIRARREICILFSYPNYNSYICIYNDMGLPQGCKGNMAIEAAGD